MRFLSRWWKRWGLVDILCLVGGVVFSGAYLVWSDRSGLIQPVLDLWPNIATEILGVWLSVRIIESFISGREERRKVRDRLTGNLNFMLTICRRITRDFHRGNLTNLQSEIGFYRDKAALKPRSWKKHLTKEERYLVDNAFGLGEQILKRSRLARQALDDVEKIRYDLDIHYLTSPGNQIKKRLDQYVDSRDQDSSRLLESITSIREQFEQPGDELEKRELALKYCERAEGYVAEVTAFSNLMHDLEEDVSRFRRLVWSELAS